MFAGFEGSRLMIDIDDEEVYKVISAEYDKNFNDFEEYEAYVAQVCSILIEDIK